jgi:hypothetical protein
VFLSAAHIYPLLYRIARQCRGILFVSKWNVAQVDPSNWRRKSETFRTNKLTVCLLCIFLEKEYVNTWSHLHLHTPFLCFLANSYTARNVFQYLTSPWQILFTAHSETKHVALNLVDLLPKTFSLIVNVGRLTTKLFLCNVLIMFYMALLYFTRQIIIEGFCCFSYGAEVMAAVTQHTTIVAVCMSRGVLQVARTRPLLMFGQLSEPFIIGTSYRIIQVVHLFKNVSSSMFRYIFIPRSTCGGDLRVCLRTLWWESCTLPYTIYKRHCPARMTATWREPLQTNWQHTPVYKWLGVCEIYITLRETYGWWYSCWWGETMSLNCGHQRDCFSSLRWYMSMENHDGMISTGKTD